MKNVVSFAVSGHPISQGSKNPVVPHYKDGTPVRRHKESCPFYGIRGRAPEYVCRCPLMINVVEDNAKELDAWRDCVKLVAQAKQVGDPLDGLLVAGFTFFLKRPLGHYGTGRNARVLKHSAPAAPAVVPDVGKLARAVEDALSGITYTDDSRIVTHYSTKRYVHRWEEEGVHVTVALANMQTVGDMIAAGEMMTAEEEMGQLGLLDALAL
jgi:Holliday junction resolvase RusA-like endonuclease